MQKNVIIKGISFDREKLKKADAIVKDRKIKAVKDRSGLVDYALDLVFEKLAQEENCKVEA